MKLVKVVLAVAIGGAVLIAAVPFEASAAAPPPLKKAPVPVAACRAPHNMTLVDVDMRPVQVHQGNAVQGWTIKIRGGFNDACLTTIKLKDHRGHVAGETLQPITVHPGERSYPIPATQAYRFDQADHCYTATVDILGNQVEIDKAKTFCAKRVAPPPFWTMQGQS